MLCEFKRVIGGALKKMPAELEFPAAIIIPSVSSNEGSFAPRAPEADGGFDLVMTRLDPPLLVNLKVDAVELVPRLIGDVHPFEGTGQLAIVVQVPFVVVDI
jgi:hypothetical protein